MRRLHLSRRILPHTVRLPHTDQGSELLKDVRGTLLPAPMRFALLQIGLYSFSKVGTAIDTSQHIVEIDGLFCCTHTPLCLLHRQHGQGCKSTDVLPDLGDLGHPSLFIAHALPKSASH